MANYKLRFHAKTPAAAVAHLDDPATVAPDSVKAQLKAALQYMPADGGVEVWAEGALMASADENPSSVGSMSVDPIQIIG